jgi:hypothetical protein
VTSDGFALAVGVSCDIDCLGILGRVLELLDDLLFAGHDLIGGFEVVLDVYAEALFGEILDMTNRCENGIGLTQVFIDCLRLGRRLTMTSDFVIS